MSDLIDGIAVKMGGKEYIVPPLTFKQLQKLEPSIALISSLKGAPTGKQYDAVISIVQTALSRNYPDLNAEAVSGLLDLGNMRSVIQAIMGVSGLVSSGE